MIRSIPFAALMLAVLAHSACADEKKTGADRQTKEGLKRIVFIVTQPDHPFGTHMYPNEAMLLAKCLKQTNNVQPVIMAAWPKTLKVLEEASAVVFYTSPAGNIILNGPQAKEAERLLADGMGFAAIHWGTGATGPGLGERYLKVLGGWFDTERGGGGLTVIPTKLERIGNDHPIFRGWKEFPIRDEIYLRTKLEPEAKPILKVKVKEGEDQVVGWTYERPGSKQGRSFGLTLGHFHDNFGIDEFRRVIVNGILWTAHIDVPKEGAPVEVTAKDLDIGMAPPQKQDKN